MRSLIRWLRRSVAVPASLTLAGCMVGPDFSSPAAPSVEGYTVERHLKRASATAVPGGTGQSFVSSEKVYGQWWGLFHSRQVNALVEEAVRNHPDLRAAQFALRSAREKVLAEGGSLLPEASLSNSATREKSGTASAYTLYNASVSVSYSLDIFGGTRRQIEELQAQADYQRFELEATYLSLTANVVTAAITDASLRAQIAATEDIIRAERDQLDRVQRQFELGAVAQSDVASQQSTLAQTEATLPPLQKQLAQERDQLMAYLGRLPSEDQGEKVDLSALALPRKLPVSLPSSLVRQRPDIRVAEATLHAATAQVGVDVANMLPQVTLTGSYGGSGNSISNMFSAEGIAWSAATSVTQTIFDGGSKYHTKEASVAAFEQDLATYKSTVISAFQDVADSFRAVQFDADTLKAQAAAEKAAADSLRIAEEQYRAGATSYATIIDAQQTYQNARISRVKAQASRFTDTVALFQSLGGGWWNRVDETPDAAPRVKPGYFAGPSKKVLSTAFSRN
ncbi:efflux transporter outer membrane subunit [Mesorhizobium sp. B2-3-3]|nr:efflux transporter outer membrane subunit [Mesorhizobium sp. B2-3-3]